MAQKYKLLWSILDFQRFQMTISSTGCGLNKISKSRHELTNVISSTTIIIDDYVIILQNGIFCFAMCFTVSHHTVHIGNTGYNCVYNFADRSRKFFINILMHLLAWITDRKHIILSVKTIIIWLGLLFVKHKHYQAVLVQYVRNYG